MGVSLGTVSAVLNGNGRASEETRERVRKAIEHLGYRPDLYASNLARHETRLFGVVVSNLQNQFFAETAQAIEEEASLHGHQVSLMATNFAQDQHRAVIEHLLKARIAGLAVMTSEHDEGARRLVLASGVPSVFLDLQQPEKNISTIRVDSRGGMLAAVEYLLGLGHRNLLFVQNSQQAGAKRLISHKLREEGFLAAVRANTSSTLDTETVDITGPGADAGEQAIMTAFRKKWYSAVIATTDNVALGVYHGLQSRGLRIPHDVSVVGFDNTYFSRFLNPPLTTVDVPRTSLSRLVVQALLKPEPGRVLQLPTSLVVRGSAAAADVGLRLQPQA